MSKQANVIASHSKGYENSAGGEIFGSFCYIAFQPLALTNGSTAGPVHCSLDPRTTGAGNPGRPAEPLRGTEHVPAQGSTEWVSVPGNSPDTLSPQNSHTELWPLELRLL